LSGGVEVVKNPFDKNILDMTPTEEWEQVEDLRVRNETSLLDLNTRKAVLDSRRQNLDLERKEEDLETVDFLNKRMYGLVSTIANQDVFERLMTSEFTTLKEVNEGVKAIQGIKKLRDDMIQGAFDQSANTGKRKRIEFAFSGQGVSIAARIDTDGE
jgi:hypothetical protein